VRVLDLFSGVGGFSLGLERAGMTTVAFCEIEPFCRAVLRKHWPDVPQFEDVRKLRGEDVGPVDLVCGGYPCQPFSTAGERRGAEDDRHLWPEMRRIISECRPDWVLAENVAGHVSMGLDDVLSDLGALGYASRAFVIPACAVDASHRRDRVWIVAHSARVQQGREIEWTKRKRTGPRSEPVPLADTVSIRQQGQRQSFHACDQEALGDWQATEPVNGCLGSKWLPEPGVGRVANGVPNRVDRLKALGNAVVPQVVEIIGRAIMQARPHD